MFESWLEQWAKEVETKDSMKKIAFLRALEPLRKNNRQKNPLLEMFFFSRNSNRSLDASIQALEEKSVDYEVRRLSAGDFLWICRETHDESKVVESKVVILPYIVEQKRMDNLPTSIKDGLFHYIFKILEIFYQKKYIIRFQLAIDLFTVV